MSILGAADVQEGHLDCGYVQEDAVATGVYGEIAHFVTTLNPEGSPGSPYPPVDWNPAPMSGVRTGRGHCALQVQGHAAAATGLTPDHEKGLVHARRCGGCGVAKYHSWRNGLGPAARQPVQRQARKDDREVKQVLGYFPS